MGIKDQAKRIAAGASVALATSGLSNCRDGGGFCDPAPPPLQCDLVGTGQTLSATGRKTADGVDVTIVHGPYISYTQAAGWQVDSVTNVLGATLKSTQLPRPHSLDTLRVSLALPAGGTQASFAVIGRIFGWQADQVCLLQRTFHVDVSAVGVSVHEAAPALPLSARDSAHIALLSRDGRTVELAAGTTFAGPLQVSWAVSGGDLGASVGSPVRWTLPAEPGIYQAELVIDYGSAGLGIDHLALEVS